MSFKELLLRAKAREYASAETILAMYRPLLMKEAIVEGSFDEDLYQELCLTLLGCIQKFKVS